MSIVATIPLDLIIALVVVCIISSMISLVSAVVAAIDSHTTWAKGFDMTRHALACVFYAKLGHFILVFSGI